MKTLISQLSLAAGVTFLVALSVPGDAEAQVAASGSGGGASIGSGSGAGGSFGGLGGGSSFGRISGGGGSYGHLTHGFTARRPSTRIPINPRTMANGTANTLRRGRTEHVPINPLTMADGTANELRRPPKEERHRPGRGRFVVDGRPYYHYLLPSRAGAASYPMEAERIEPTRRRRLGRAPTATTGEAATRARLSRVGAPTAAGFGAERMPTGAAGQPGIHTGGAAPGVDSRSGVQSSATTKSTTVSDSGPGIAPRVKPPIPAAEAGTEAPLAQDECAEVRITTAGGIQWRQRVPLQTYGASTPDDVAVRLQEILARGDPLTLSGPDGSFTVRASLVENLIVGPCRGF